MSKSIDIHYFYEQFINSKFCHDRKLANTLIETFGGIDIVEKEDVQFFLNNTSLSRFDKEIHFSTHAKEFIQDSVARILDYLKCDIYQNMDLDRVDVSETIAYECSNIFKLGVTKKDVKVFFSNGYQHEDIAKVVMIMCYKQLFWEMLQYRQYLQKESSSQ